MTRYKGSAGSKTISHEFPHMVETPLPAGGLGSRLDAMHDWHIARGIKNQRGPQRREMIDGDTQFYIRWCFADRGTAEAFATELSGKLL